MGKSQSKNELLLISIFETDEYLLLKNNLIWVDDLRIGLIGIHKKTKNTEILIYHVFGIEKVKCKKIPIDTKIYNFLSFDKKQNQFGAIYDKTIIIWDSEGKQLLQKTFEKEIIYFGWMDIWDKWFYVLNDKNETNNLIIISFDLNDKIGEFKILLPKENSIESKINSIITNGSDLIIITYSNQKLIDQKFQYNNIICYTNKDGSILEIKQLSSNTKIAYCHLNNSIIYLSNENDGKKYYSTLKMIDSIYTQNMEFTFEPIENINLHTNNLIAFYIRKHNGSKIKVYDISTKKSKEKDIIQTIEL